MLLLIVAAVILLVTYIINQSRRPPKFPPGPSWLPFVGNLPKLKKLSRELGGQHLALSELAKRYNTNVLGLKLGNDYVVTVFSYPTVRAVLTGEEYEGRPDNFFIRLRSMGTRKGVTCTDGELWSVQRNFVIRHLRNLGYGKKPMELMIREEVLEILSIIEEEGPEIEIGNIIAPGVINVLWALTTGTRISRKDSRLEHLLEMLSVRSKAFDMSGGTLTQHPWLRYLAPEKTGYNLIKKLNTELKKFLMDVINEHHANWHEMRNDDIIFSFISEMKQANGNITTFTDDQLVMLCLDIFIAGSQTTSNTLDFAFLMMVIHQDIQFKVQAQLDQTIENTVPMDYSDRLKLPYVEAVLFEVERYCHVTPICGPRRVLRDTVLEGYYIPKDTTVLISLHSIHNDEEYWKDPQVFRPERFLDAEGKLIVPERLVPFGLGRRRCLGEILARNCIFVLFAEIIRRYSISIVPGAASPTGIPVPGITLSPEKYRARFLKRY